MFFNRLIAFFLLVLILPFLSILYLIVKLTSKGSCIFRQERIGKNKRPFTIYKIRTMVENAERLKSQVSRLNEADGPVFKIYDDPRYTRVGKFLAHTALDELPQLINIIKGEMAFVGPRPLPVTEVRKVPKKYAARFSVLPGMTSPWVVAGTDHSSFERWMKLDVEYVKKKSVWYDFKIIVQTVWFLFRLLYISINMWKERKLITKDT